MANLDSNNSVNTITMNRYTSPLDMLYKNTTTGHIITGESLYYEYPPEERVDYKPLNTI